MIDSALKREIKTSLYGKGDRPAKFEALAKLRAAKADLSSPTVMTNFNNCMSKHGRAAVAVCVAATLIQRSEQLDYWRNDWAQDVINLLPFLTTENLRGLYIDDNLHPARICEYAGSLIKYTTETR